MYREITTEQLLKGKDYTDGFVVLNYGGDVEHFKHTMIRRMSDSFAPILENMEYIQTENSIDIIIRKKDIPQDETIQLLYNILMTFLMEHDLATTITSYRYMITNPPTERNEQTMTFFEKELSRCTEQFDDKKFIGNAMYIPLGDNNRLKVEFKTLGVHEKYEGIRLTALDKTSGTIDSTIIRFDELWGKRPVPHNPNFKDGIAPYVWKSSGKYEWYAYKPTDYDMQMLTEQIEDYSELFSEQEQTQNFGMTQTM